MSGVTQTDWKLLHDLNEGTDVKCALVILNRPLNSQLKLLHLLWRKALLRVAVDGGSNRLYDALSEEDRHKFVPELINGDLDSARSDVLEYYRNKGTEIRETKDQDYTDFTKCLQTISEDVKDKKIEHILVLGAMGARLDQVFANIDTLYQAREILPRQQVCLLSHHSMACLLPEGSHTLQVDSGWEGEWCGLLPVGGACDHVTTTGLKWNLDKQKLRFGELISTSNTWAGSRVVTVVTDKPLIWTMGVNLHAK